MSTKSRSERHRDLRRTWLRRGGSQDRTRSRRPSRRRWPCRLGCWRTGHKPSRNGRRPYPRRTHRRMRGSPRRTQSRTYRRRKPPSRTGPRGTPSRRSHSGSRPSSCRSRSRRSDRRCSPRVHPGMPRTRRTGRRCTCRSRNPRCSCTDLRAARARMCSPTDSPAREWRCVNSRTRGRTSRPATWCRKARCPRRGSTGSVPPRTGARSSSPRDRCTNRRCPRTRAGLRRAGHRRP